MYNDNLSLQCHMDQFHCPGNALASACSFLPYRLTPQLPTITELFIVSIVLPFAECHEVGIQSMYPLQIDLCGSVICFRFFFLVLSNKFFECANLFIHLPKKTLVASRFWQLKAAINIALQAFCEYNFSTHWLHTKGYNCWIVQ